VELRARGYYSHRRTVTPLRALVLLALVGLAVWKLGPRVWARKPKAAPVAAQPAATPPPPPPAPKPVEAPAITPTQEAAEIKGDVIALSPKFDEDIAAFEKLKTEIAAAGSAVRDYPYKVQLVGTDIDHVPVRSVAARQYQTRFVRILYDASRELAEVGRGRGDTSSHKAAFEKTSESLKQFQTEWASFAKKY
jgi:type IV secretory pathway VirB10-like protein